MVEQPSSAVAPERAFGRKARDRDGLADEGARVLATDIGSGREELSLGAPDLSGNRLPQAPKSIPTRLFFSAIPVSAQKSVGKLMIQDR
jgi:hypothetical protein